MGTWGQGYTVCYELYVHDNKGAHFLPFFICACPGNFRRHEMFAIFCGWTHVLRKSHSRNNHGYTACVHGHQPLAQCLRKFYLRIISLIHCNGEAVNILDCENFRVCLK